MIQTGERVGPYEIERQLGSGAFADVYLARQVVLDQLVALKVVRVSEAEGAETQGAQIMCRLRHPNAVAVYYADRIDGRLAIAMEYVDGRTLRDIVKQDGPVPPVRACVIAAQAADAVNAMHSLGFAHLDLKPANLLIESGPVGTVKIADFGIAQIAGVQGKIQGSPAFMAPEQFSGKAGPASDLWALGGVLLYMLTGEPPLLGKSVSECALASRNTLQTFPPRIARLPEAVRPIVARCLAPEPADRFASAADLARALREVRMPTDGTVCKVCGASVEQVSGLCPECTYAGKEPVKTPLPVREQNVPQQKKSRHGVVWAVAMLLLAAVGAGAGAWYFRRPVPVIHAPVISVAPPSAEELARNADDQRFAAAQAFEQLPGQRISLILSNWEDYQAGQPSSEHRAYAADRSEFWKQQLAGYDGYAMLTVLSAAGLPPAHRVLWGPRRPDPFFVVEQNHQPIYRSQTHKQDSSPVFGEAVRVHLQPGADLVLEIRDQKFIGSGLLFRQDLTPLPPDGKFQSKDGSSVVDLDIEREK